MERFDGPKPTAGCNVNGRRMFISYDVYQSLHVSGSYVPIIRRYNCICATLGTCYSVWMTVWYAWCIPVIHTEQQVTSVTYIQLYLLMTGT